MAVQTKKRNPPSRVGRTRKIIDTLRHGFNMLRKRPLNLEVKKHTDIPKMDKLLLQPQATFVFIKASWCGHCKNYEPKWKNFVNTPGRNANMVAMPVGLQRNSQILKNVPLDGVPTVLRVQNGTVTAVDIDEANDPEVMTQEVTRRSNDPINGPALANAIVTANPNVVEEEEEEEEPAGMVATKEMELMVNKVNTNPRNLGETNGSRKNDQGALNLAIPVENLKVTSVTEKPINSINLAEIPSANQSIQVATTPNKISMPEPNLKPIPAAEPLPAPTAAAATAEAPTEAPTEATAAVVTDAKSVNLSAPLVVNAIFERNAKKANNIINKAQEEISANNDPSVTEVPPSSNAAIAPAPAPANTKQRGGSRKYTLKKKGKLLNFFRVLTKKARKI